MGGTLNDHDLFLRRVNGGLEFCPPSLRDRVWIKFRFIRFQKFVSVFLFLQLQFLSCSKQQEVAMEQRFPPPRDWKTRRATSYLAPPGGGLGKPGLAVGGAWVWEGPGRPEVAPQTGAGGAGVPDAASRAPEVGGFAFLHQSTLSPSCRRRSFPGRWWPSYCCVPGSGALPWAPEPPVGPSVPAPVLASTCSAASCPPCTTRTACPGEPGRPAPAASSGSPSLTPVTHGFFTQLASAPRPLHGVLPHPPNEIL